jgi:hypothetical protein
MAACSTGKVSSFAPGATEDGVVGHPAFASIASSSGAATPGAACVPVAVSCAATGAPADASVLQRGNDLLRRGTFVEALLTKQSAGSVTLDTSFNATFAGSMRASVLYLQAGPAGAGCPATGAAATTCMATTRPAGNGLFFAATNGNVVYALDETTGAIVWQTNINALGGGDGIRGTPVIDPDTRALIVATGVSGHHEVHSLSVDDGSEYTGWPVILSSSTLAVDPGTGSVPFNSPVQNQHGALLLANGIVYVPFGGQNDDTGDYNGWVVSINENDPSQVNGWVTLSGHEGVWGHGGLASDGAGSVFAVTGNGHAGKHGPMDSDAEEVVRLTGMSSFARNANDVYYPALWTEMDAVDHDFGASTPAYVPLPHGSVPPAVLVAPSKPGHVFFLDGTNLSGGSYPNPGGEIADVVVADTTSESVYTSPTIYSTASGIHAAIDVGIGPVCPPGSPTSTNGKMIVSMLMDPGCVPFAKTTWCATVAGNPGNSVTMPNNLASNHYNEPPISTTSDGGCSDALVWFINGSQLSVVDGDTGVPLVPQPSGTCNNIESMNFPIAVKNRIVVAADGQLCAWSLPGR